MCGHYMLASYVRYCGHALVNNMMSLQGNDRVIEKLLKVLNGDMNIITARNDKDLAPILEAFNRGKPC